MSNLRDKLIKAERSALTELHGLQRQTRLSFPVVRLITKLKMLRQARRHRLDKCTALYRHIPQQPTDVAFVYPALRPILSSDSRYSKTDSGSSRPMPWPFRAISPPPYMQ